jgi:hypothetical protein
MKNISLQNKIRRLFYHFTGKLFPQKNHIIYGNKHPVNPIKKTTF